MTDRHNRQENSRKGLRPALRRCGLARRFYPKHRSGRAVAWLSDAVQQQLRTEPTILGLGVGLAFTRQLSEKGNGVRGNSEALKLFTVWSRSQGPFPSLPGRDGSTSLWQMRDHSTSDWAESTFCAHCELGQYFTPRLTSDAEFFPLGSCLGHDFT